MKHVVEWQARSQATLRRREFDTPAEADKAVEELLEAGRQFKADWVVVPRVVRP